MNAVFILGPFTVGFYFSSLPFFQPEGAKVGSNYWNVEKKRSIKTVA